MATARSSLTKFSVNPSVVNHEAKSPERPGPVTRGKNKRIAVAVRLNPEDWYRASELALREHSSLQQLLVCGLSELLRQRGLPPLTGT